MSGISDKLKISGLYFFLLAGGLWHILGIFQTIMKLFAGPLLIILAVWLWFEYIKNGAGETARKNRATHHLFYWAMLVVISSFLVEWVGVKTGKIFGEYRYGDTLWPQIDAVPVSIGFAWLLMMLSSTALMERIPLINKSNLFVRIITIAIFMTVFDLIMEPAAIKLGYWSWAAQTVPLQNYAAWFILSLMLAGAGSRLGLFRHSQPVIVFHAYFAQLIYFIMVLF